DSRVELRWSDVPVGELAVLAGDECVKVDGSDQGIYARYTRWVLVQSILRDPFGCVLIGPGIRSFRSLPIERFSPEWKCGSRSGCHSWKVANLCQLGLCLGRDAVGWRRWSKLVRRCQQ